MAFTKQHKLSILECLVQWVLEGDMNGGWLVEPQPTSWEGNGNVRSLQEENSLSQTGPWITVT